MAPPITEPGANPHPQRAPRRRWSRRARLGTVAAGIVLAVGVLALPDSPLRIRLLELLPDPLLARAASLPMGDPWPHVLLGERQLARGKAKTALDHFNQAQARGCSSLRWATDTVDALRAGGIYADTAARTRELIGLEPKSGRLYRVLGQCQVALGELPEGIASLEQAAALTPADPAVWIALGAARARLEGYTPQTAQPWITGHARCPHDAAIRYGLADALVGLGRYSEAEVLVRTLPGEPVPALPEGRALYARAWYARGVVLRRQDPDPERLAQASEALEHALSLDPALPDAHYELGVLQDEAGQPKVAVRSLEAAIRLRPYAHPFWYRLCLAYRRLGREPDARRAEERFQFLVRTGAVIQEQNALLLRDPDSLAPHLKLAQVFLERQEWGAAQRHLAAVLRAQPQNSEALRLWKRLPATSSNAGDRGGRA